MVMMAFGGPITALENEDGTWRVKVRHDGERREVKDESGETAAFASMSEAARAGRSALDSWRNAEQSND